jgi:hypothetical protein
MPKWRRSRHPLVAADGGIFSYGSAPFYGSMGGRHLDKSIVGMTAERTTGVPFGISGNGTAALNSGQHESLDLTLSNPNKDAITIGPGAIGVTITSSQGACPVAGDFTVTHGLSTGVSIPGEATETLVARGQ